MVDGSSDRARFDVRNWGESTLEVKLHPPAWSDGAIHVGPGPQAQIPPGETYAFELFLDRPLATDRRGALSLTTNDPSSPETLIPVEARRDPQPNVRASVRLGVVDGSSPVHVDMRWAALRWVGPNGEEVSSRRPEVRLGDATIRWTATGEPPRSQRIEAWGRLRPGAHEVEVEYRENCSAVPTILAAGILGLTVEAVLGAMLAGHVSADVLGTIVRGCVARAGASATVELSTDASAQVLQSTLQKPGDRWIAATLHVADDGTVRLE
ncbi:MAG: hypothetical protein HC923_02540 [Myxococcales bacterium]|nr:hypothetical protein [Myxococcales bacterium]